MNLFTDSLGDFENDASSVLKRATIFIRPFVCGFRQKACKKVAMSCVKLNTVIASFVEIFGIVSKAMNDFLYVIQRRRRGLENS